MKEERKKLSNLIKDNGSQFEYDLKVVKTENERLKNELLLDKRNLASKDEVKEEN